MWKCKDLMKMTDAVKPAKTGLLCRHCNRWDYFWFEKLCRMQKKRKNERG